MSRAPELGDECRPGGSCPECNAVTYYCADCGDEEVSEEGAFCAECEVQHTCANCGGGIDKGDVYCGPECRSEAEAYESGDAREDRDAEARI